MPSGVRMSHQDYIEQVTAFNPDITVTGRFITSNDKISARCNVCGYEWETQAGVLATRTGCRPCMLLKAAATRNVQGTYRQSVRDRTHLVIATNISTGEVLRLNSPKEWPGYGFNETGVRECVAKRQRKHKGHTFRYATESEKTEYLAEIAAGAA